MMVAERSGKIGTSNAEFGGSMREEQSLIEHIKRHGKIAAPEEMSAHYRGEIVRVMSVLVDSWLAAAAGFADTINRAPGLAERQAMVRITAEKLTHAGAVLELLRPFGVQPDLYLNTYPWAARIGRDVDLGLRRIAGDKRLNVFHYPLQSWHDAVLVNWLVGASLAIQLRDLADSSYSPLAIALSGMAQEEEKLAALSQPLLAAAIRRDGKAGPTQAALDYWYPRAAATFGHRESDRFAVYKRYGLRKESNDVLLNRWRSLIDPQLAALGLVSPA
jgi:ring-1,2-phenylacetyl-CoA epoxidase subunit PaaA